MVENDNFFVPLPYVPALSLEKDRSDQYATALSRCYHPVSTCQF